MTLTPAYGRDYKSKKEILADWNADKDFTVADLFSGNAGSYVNRPQVTDATVNIRYKRLTAVCVLTRGKNGVWK